MRGELNLTAAFFCAGIIVIMAANPLSIAQQGLMFLNLCLASVNLYFGLKARGKR